MKSLFQPPWSRYTDEEFVLKHRRSLDKWDRYWHWLLAFNAIVIVGICWLYGKIIEVMLGFVQPANVPFALGGFITGVVFGLGCGMMLIGPLHSMVMCITGFRSERLMLKYHDAIKMIAQREIEMDDVEYLPRDSEE